MDDDEILLQLSCDKFDRYCQLSGSKKNSLRLPGMSREQGYDPDGHRIMTGVCTQL